jgi:hypothetical protein
MGRVDWAGAKGSLAHCVGNYIEARALAAESAPRHASSRSR